MPVFRYTARNRSGQQQTATIEIGSRAAAIRSLKDGGLLVLKINEVQEEKPKGDKKYSLNPLEYRSMRSSDIEHEFHQIAVMLRSGISLLEALDMTAKYSRIGVRKVWNTISKRIEQGTSFTEALSEHKFFTEFTIQMIKVGEATGSLHTTMDQASNEMAASRKIKKKVTSAKKYPLFVLIFAIGIAALMLIKIVPQIKNLLLIMGKPMPPLTKALIDSSDWIMTNGPGILIFAAVFIVVVIILRIWPPSRWWMDYLGLSIPVMGNIMQLNGTVVFGRAAGMMLSAGVPVVETLETMERLHKNTYLASRIAVTKKKVLQGSSLTDPLSAKISYMPLMLRMMKVGESSGTLDDILQEMTEYHEELLTHAIDTLVGMIAPAITVLVGGMVGFVYGAFLVAMFTAAGGSPQ
jgi:type IV pilus assembly protein PilC